MSSYVYILKETEKLDSGEQSVFLEAYATQTLAEETLVKQIRNKIEEAKQNEDSVIRVVESEEDYAELVDEEGNSWTFSIERLSVEGI